MHSLAFYLYLFVFVSPIQSDTHKNSKQSQISIHWGHLTAGSDWEKTEAEWEKEKAIKDSDNESMPRNVKWSQWNQNWFNDGIMKTDEIEGAREELENMKVKAEKKAPNVMKVAEGKIYTRQSEGEMES